MILNYLDLSLSHITKQDSVILEWHCENKQYIEGIGFPYEYDHGYFIFLGEDDTHDISSIFSKSVIDMVKYAKENKCELIRLDGDGPLVESLPTHEW